MKNLNTKILFFIFSSFAIAQGSLDSGLVAFYPFNGNAIDITGNGHNGVVNGGILTNDRFNQQEKAYTFPNLHNNIVLDNSAGLNLESGFTLNAWIKYKNVDCGFVGKHNCWVINGFYFGISSNQIYLRVGNSTWSEVITNETFIEDKWYMVTGVFDSSSSTIKIYVDGMLKVSGTGTYNNFSSASMTISEASNGCPNGNMPGAIDEVKIYNRPLSDAEILAEYNSSNTDLIAYYPFNGNANDESGNNINPNYIGSGVTLTADRFGLNNRAFYFDGNNGSYIRLAADSLPTTSRTISFWINSLDLPGGKVPFSYGGNGCNTSSFIMVMNLSGNSAYNVTGHCNQSMISSSYSTPPVNTWKHWVITIEGSTQRLYIDGELKQTENNYSGSSFVAGRSAIIGGLIYTDGNTVYVDPNAGYFMGKIDDIRIYNHAITEQQVIELYNDSTTYTPPTMEDGLALFLPFNGNANDESGNNNNGTVIGSSLTQDRFGLNNKAFSFDGTDDFISIADNPNLFSDDLTISWWYKITEILGGEKVVIGWVDGGHRYQQFFNGGQLSYLNGYNVSQPGIYFNPIYGLNDLNIWKNVVVTYKKLTETTSTTSIYVDGELKQTDNHNLTMDYVSGPEFFIGKNHNGNFFKGALDDFRIFNRILDATEILALYQDSTTYTPPGIEDGLVAFFPFNGNAIDESINNNNGTIYGAQLSNDRFDVSGRSYSFNGSTDYIDIGNDQSLKMTEKLSISTWVSPSVFPLSSYHNIISDHGDGNNNTKVLRFYQNAVEFLLGPEGSNEVRYVFPNSIADQWQHITATYDGSFMRLFLNGAIVDSVSRTGTITANPLPVLIGNSHFNEFFPGKIDDIRLYNRALSNEEVVLLYNDSTTYYPPIEDGLVAYLPFNGNTNDSTFNNNDGINYGGLYVKDRYGITDAAMFFDSLNSYIEGVNPGNNLPIGNSPRSFSSWIKALSYDDYGNNIFHYGTAQPAPTNFHFLIKQIVALGNGYGYGVLYGNTNVVDSTWHFVTGVYEGGTERIAKLFVDGKLDATGNITSEPNTILGSNWRIGRFMEGDVRFNGNIDEVKVYEIPLTNQQIWDKYKATTTAPTLLFPGNDSTLINPTSNLVLDWDSTITATSYRLLISNDSLFNTITYDTIVTVSSFAFENWSGINLDNINWKVRTINDGGIGPWSETNRFNIILTDVEEETQLPTEFALLHNYPNPFNPSTTISYHLPKTSNVELKVYDVLGHEIATLVNEVQSAGRYTVDFNATNISSGVYLYKIIADDFIQTKKMILIR